MKKTHVIVIIGQTILVFMFLIYAFYQNTEAERQRQIAIELHERANLIEEKAVEKISQSLYKLDSIENELNKCRQK